MHWSEGCACHDIDATNHHARVKLFRQRFQSDLDGCPLRSRRAPEMANNAMMHLLRRLLQVGSQHLLTLHAVVRLGEEDRALVMREFSRGRQHLLLVFHLKFSHWRQLPWVCCGLAHPDPAIAMSCGKRALELYHTAPPSVRGHIIVERLCSPASPVYAELQEFVHGRSTLRLLPALDLFCGRLAFIPIAERWVESLHASVKKQLCGAPHYSAVHLAWAGVQSRLRRLLSESAASIFDFAGCCQIVRHPRLALKEMGFSKHPTVVGMLADRQGQVRALGREFRPAVVEVLYHTDPATIFQDFGHP